MGRADGERLIRDRKLVLLVDLDQTLIHTTNDNIPPNIKDVYHFQLYGPNSPWYHTRLRPGTHTFLSNISQFFELHICTFGARNYAHMIAMFLDNDQAYFANRILSRDECFDPTSKKANLRALFPCGDDMVCIIDDREDVWNHASNLIHVKPYHFFKHTGDINAPPGLDKHEADNKDGVDLNNIKKTKLNGKKTEVNEENEDTNGVDAVVPPEEEEEESVLKTTNGECPHEEPPPESEEKPSTEEEKVSTTEESSKEEVPLASEDATAPNTVQTPPETEKEKEQDSQEFKETTKQEDKKEEDLVEIEDPDDYLLYLEDILKMVHKRFYEEYDKLEAGTVPDLKVIIPAVRSEILKGCRLVFSGLVPTHIKLEQSKAYQVARSLGAIVTQDIDDDSTHLVAVRPGTAKVNAGRRKKHVRIVTPDWLWACAERWERIEEGIFPLSSKGSKNRHPPPHCSSPEHVPNYPIHEQPTARKRTPSGRFMDTINPLMSFSSDDIADMDKEVEDILDDETDDSDNDNDADNETENETESENVTSRELQARLMQEEQNSSSSTESLTSEFPKGFKRTRETPPDEFPSAKFRRGEELGSDVDFGQDSNSEGSVEAQDEADDGEWNMMGAALEREFLSNN